MRQGRQREQEERTGEDKQEREHEDREERGVYHLSNTLVLNATLLAEPIEQVTTWGNAVLGEMTIHKQRSQ
jgi:hypothetical protein